MRSLDPLRLPNGVVVPNRLAVAPMTTSQSEPDGRISPAERAWLHRLAHDGYGMVLTCAAAVSHTGIAFPNQLSLGDDRFVADLGGVASEMRTAGTLGIVQLCHGGGRALPALTGQAARSASRYEIPGFVPPDPFTVAELEQLVDDHVAAAERAVRAGFAGVEMHGANGYVFTQFLSTAKNLRDDAYGGSLANRARLARDVARAVRARVPADFIVGFRLSFEGMGLDLDETIQVLRWLAEDGVDYGHVSHLALAAPSVKYPNELALRRIRAGVSLPLMAAGGVFSAADAEGALELGADLVAVGRAAIGNTHVPARFARGEALIRPPYTREHLASVAVSPAFVGYLTAPGPVASMNLVAPEPDNTAVRTALWRALHGLADAPPHVIDDQVGVQLAAPGPGWRERPDMSPFTRPFRASIVARARFVEDLVLAGEVDQYVILGAGLDTLVQRRDTGVHVFEIDQPGPQAWKRQRLAELGLRAPTFVPVDFEAGERWWDHLVAAGFDAGRPAIVSSLGVSMYLTHDAIRETLRQLAGLAPGSTFVMSFMLPIELADPALRPGIERAAAGARAAGTPWLSFLTPAEALAMATEAGFPRVEHVSAEALAARWFAGRSDGLAPPRNAEELLVARTG